MLYKTVEFPCHNCNVGLVNNVVFKEILCYDFVETTYNDAQTEEISILVDAMLA